jgi:hypothetical protein
MDFHLLWIKEAYTKAIRCLGSVDLKKDLVVNILTIYVGPHFRI